MNKLGGKDMATGNVGAGILNIITESLYDKPLVVFREYVQNSVDSFLKTMATIEKEQLCCEIFRDANNLYFLDNGNGIDATKFFEEMKHIAYSSKIRTVNMGYKGIGRLSGISYCDMLTFVNIISYKDKRYQKYTIDCIKYNKIKKTEGYSSLSFEDLMEQIGEFKDEHECILSSDVQDALTKYKSDFKTQDRGFLVILGGVSPIFAQTSLEKNIYTELGWLLPVDFKQEIYQTNQKVLFKNLLEPGENGVIPAMSFKVYYNDVLIERPIEASMLRDYTCKCDLKYAVGFHSFRHDKIAVEKGNDFCGIKIYIDNMLLCDETELIPILLKYGLIDHTANELVQSVKGIGAMIYITDKINISANARRTFIEITDSDSIEFLKRLAEFIERIYVARYALSKYSSGKKNVELKTEKLNELKTAANEALRSLAAEEIVADYQEDAINGFESLSDNEKKQLVKKKITKELNEQLKVYLSQTTLFDYENAYEDFKLWIRSN